MGMRQSNLCVVMILAVPALAQAPSGTSLALISGMHDPPSSPVRLTEEGTADWSVWSGAAGEPGATKRGTMRAAVTGTAIARDVESPFQLDTGSSGKPPGVLLTGQDGSGVRVTARADRTARVLKLYVGVSRGQALLQACVRGTDDLACYTDTSLSAKDGLTGRVYTINYTGTGTGQQVAVDLKLIRGTHAESGVMLAAASLATVGRNAPPVVSIISPKPGESFGAPAEIVLEADARDPDGSISRVEFYGLSVAVKLGVASKPPYRITVPQPTAYGGAFCARAYDNHGRATDSEVVRYHVRSGARAEPPAKPLAVDFPAPGDPRMGWEGVASLVELPDGDLLAAWFAGKYELSPDSAIWSSRLPRGAYRWTPPRVILDAPGLGEGNPVLFFQNGLLWCFYTRLYGAAVEFSRLYVSTSRDGGETWSAATPLPEPAFPYPTGTLPSTRPVVLPNGHWLLPLNREAYDPDAKRQWFSLFLASTDAGRTWRETAPLYSFPGNIQPAVAVLGPDRLLSFFRVRGRGNNLWRSTSTDQGRTWEPLQQTDIPNPSARVALLRLQTGELMLAYNHSSTVRTPLVLALSTDGGQTWPHRRAIETGEAAYAYPYAIQTRDGKIHVVYSVDYQQVKHVTVDRGWLLAGGDEVGKPRSTQ